MSSISTTYIVYYLIIVSITIHIIVLQYILLYVLSYVFETGNTLFCGWWVEAGEIVTMLDELKTNVFNILLESFEGMLFRCL